MTTYEDVLKAAKACHLSAIAFRAADDAYHSCYDAYLRTYNSIEDPTPAQKEEPTALRAALHIQFQFI